MNVLEKEGNKKKIKRGRRREHENERQKATCFGCFGQKVREEVGYAYAAGPGFLYGNLHFARQFRCATPQF